MPLDGIVVRNIAEELHSLLVNGRIDKISQPEIDEIIIFIRNNGQNYRLLLSSSPNYPRVHLTDTPKENPISPPMFCMVLRKHLLGGRIIQIEQYNLDRILKIHMEAHDELGGLSSKVLYCEIMGRHSNIILVNENSGIVIDSIKHVTPEISSYRLVMPGTAYKYPPMQDKLEPLEFNIKDFERRLYAEASGLKLQNFISRNINGFSVLPAREICFIAGLEADSIVPSLDDEQKLSIIRSTSAFIERVSQAAPLPAIYYLDSDIYDFYSLELKHLGHLEKKNYSSISQAIETFYYNVDSADRVRQKTAGMLKVVNTNLDRCLKKLSIQEQKLLECKGKEKWKLFGDLIMSNLYCINKGDSKAEVLNYFNENGGSVEIPLDTILTPVENAQRYYRKYNKDKIAEVAVLEQKKENLEEINYLESQIVNLNNSTENQEIDEIRNELISLGYVKKRKKTASRKQEQSKPTHYISSEGYDIYVGRNNVQNDYLTTKFAFSEDIWMHTKNIPGSHVIIKSGGRSVSESVLLEAALLAAYYSKAKSSSNVPVDYTERKNVRKPQGAKPGMVIYYTNRTIYVTPDEVKVNNMNIVKK
jgi:predicted ribosome quality control (RQC) complex YloA/Tae2 family protein